MTQLPGITFHSLPHAQETDDKVLPKMHDKIVQPRSGGKIFGPNTTGLLQSKAFLVMSLLGDSTETGKKSF